MPPEKDSRREDAACHIVAVALSRSPRSADGPRNPSGQTWVTYPQVLAQVRTGPLIRAIINPALMDVEIKFRNLDEWHAYYPPGAQAQLQRLLHARHVHVIFVPRPKAATASTGTTGHPLRWALAGTAALALLAGGAILLSPPARLRLTGSRPAPPPCQEHDRGTCRSRRQDGAGDANPVDTVPGPRQGCGRHVPVRPVVTQR